MESGTRRHVAVTAHEIPLTREQVAQWVSEARDKHAHRGEYITARLEELQIADTDVVTGAEVRNVLHMILDDLETY